MTQSIPRFHDVYLNHPDQHRYESLFGDTAFLMFRQSEAFNKWLDRALPAEGKPVALSIQAIEALVRDRVYPTLKMASMEVVKLNRRINNLSTNNLGDRDQLEGLIEETFSDAVSESSSLAVTFLVMLARQDRIEIPVIEGITTPEYWAPSMLSTLQNLREIYRLPELAQALERYDGIKGTLAAIYDDEPVMQTICNELILGFEYPDHSHRKVSEIIAIAKSRLNEMTSLPAPVETEDTEDSASIDARP